MHHKKNNKIELSSNNGSGLGVILYGLTLLLVLIFVAINIVNSKVIENGYNSLRDAVQTASSGSVIHLLKSNRDGVTGAQKKILDGNIGNGNTQPTYDIYLQLALGYLINRNEDSDKTNDTIVKTGEINNFIKLDHQKVVNTTMALLEDAVVRRKDGEKISDTADFKIMMFFIEPYRTDADEKFFNIIAYGNGDYDTENGIEKELAISFVKSSNRNSMKEVYKEVEKQISDIVNCKYDGMDKDKKNAYDPNTNFWINLNASGEEDYSKLVREMETYPHYVIVVKDFALPTIFDGKNTNDEGAGVKSLFSLSGDGSLSVPMCALNTGKIQRQTEDAGWSQKR